MASILIPSFSGSYGSIITLGANYFELKSRPNMHLLQYRVDFTPDIDHIGVRKALVRSYEAQLGKYLFDGTLLYNVIRLPQVKLLWRTEWHAITLFFL